MKVVKKATEDSGSEGRQEILKGVPTNELSNVIGDFESEGAKVDTTQERDGTWTLVATFR